VLSDGLRGFNALRAIGVGYLHSDALRDLCTRGLWIHQGRLMADGPINEVITRYLEFTTASVPTAVPA
jgi:ABC-type polysaccharide/polyol phosphate transport system ATPase subunit